ncbi:MAG TPA: hypothetical protein DEQ14_12210 [Treponema sp.]|nr:hypothetical protein [Treponema sp.]
MKKLIVFFLLGLLLSGAVSAQFQVSGSGRAVITALGIRLGEPYYSTMGSETSWNTNGPEVTLKIIGQTPDGNIGMHLGIAAASASSNLLRPSNAKVWIKPFEWLKVTLGVFEEDDLRYKIAAVGSGLSNYELYIRGSARDENVLFHRFKSEGFGTHITLTPIENLYIGAAFGSVTNARSFTALSEDGALNILKNVQVGAGYTIPGIGFARLQYIGERPFVHEPIRPQDNSPSIRNSAGGNYYFLSREAVLANAAAFQAAFQFTAIKDLNVDIAASIPLPYEWDQGDPMLGFAYANVLSIKSQRPYVYGLGFDVNLLSPWRFYGRVDVETGAYKQYTALHTNYVDFEGTEKEGTNLLASLFVSYNLGNNWTIGLDMNMDIRKGDNRDAIEPEAAQEITKPRGGDWDETLTVIRNTVTNNYTDLGFGLWARKNIAGGDIRLAVTLKLPGIGGEAHKGAKPQLFIPIMFNYTI